MAEQEPPLDREQRQEGDDEVANRATEDTDVETDGDAERRPGEEAGSAVIDDRIAEVKRKAEEMAEREKNP